MKSSIKVLQCPCGCELEVDKRLERMYAFIKRHYGQQVKVIKGVDCEVNSKDDLVRTVVLRFKCFKTADGARNRLFRVLQRDFRHYKIVCGKKDVRLTVGVAGQAHEVCEGDV